MPVPVQSLGYSSPQYERRRPGIITAIGVLCIVISCLSGIFSFIVAGETSAVYMMTKMFGSMGRSTSMATSATAAAPPASTGLPIGDSGVAVNALQSMLSLDPAHHRELDRLMRSHGREVLGEDEDEALTGAGVRAAVTSNTPQGAGGAGVAMFTTNEGTASIFNDHAVFTSSHGSQTVTTSARRNSDSVARSFSVAVATTGPGSSGLSTAQVNLVVAAVQAAATTPPLNPAQINSLRTEVSAPTQALVTPGTPAPVISAFVQPGGNATITFNTGSALVLGPAGQVISSGVTFPRFNISGSAFIPVIAEAVASVALAIYLLVVGIVVLRGTFTAPRLLRIYCGIKIPLGLIAGIGTGWLGAQFMRSVTSMSPAGSAPGNFIFIIWGSVLGLIGLAFPVALLIALRTRTVRNYYNTVLAER